jgi:hypothetical protein
MAVGKLYVLLMQVQMVLSPAAVPPTRVELAVLQQLHPCRHLLLLLIVLALQLFCGLQQFPGAAAAQTQLFLASLLPEVDPPPQQQQKQGPVRQPAVAAGYGLLLMQLQHVLLLPAAVPASVLHAAVQQLSVPSQQPACCLLLQAAAAGLLHDTQQQLPVPGWW